MDNDLRGIKEAIFKLQPLEEYEWEAFAAHLTVKKYVKGDYLTRQDQVENHIYFLNYGATRNYFLNDGKEFTVDFQFEGEFVTAYYSFLTREPSAIIIELLEDTEVIAISRRFLTSFYHDHHRAEKIGRLIAEFQYVKRIKKEMDLLSKTAEQRYVALMEKRPELIRQISVKHLSSYLGIQPESLSRIRKMQ